MLGSGAAGIAGAGLGLVLSKEDALPVALMEATTLAGALVIGAVAPQTEYSAGDAAVGTLAGLYGVYQGAGLSLLGDASNREVAGAMMLGGALGTLGGTYLGRYLNLDSTDILMLLSGSAWGMWIGVWTAAALDEADTSGQGIFRLGVGTTAVITDVALIASGFAISELVDMPPLRFAWISIGGGVGLVAGLAGSGVANGSFKQGILWGSIGGLAAGTIITGFMDFEPREYDFVADGDSRDPTRVVPQVDVWYPSVQVQPAWGDPDGVTGEQYLMTVTGTFK